MKYVFYILGGGLMEHPEFEWKFHCTGKGKTPEEACDNAFKNDPDYNSEQKTTWGWSIGYITDTGITKL